MDTSFWTKLNPKVIELPTTKQYFDRYLYKMVVKVYGGRLIHARPGESISFALKERIEHQRTRNYAGSWWNNKMSELLSASVQQIEVLRDIKEQYKDDVKIRVEEPHVQIYAENEDMLKTVAMALTEELQTKIVSVSCPTPNSVPMLCAGKILMRGKNHRKYSHKVMIRDGMYSVEAKHRVLNYLSGLDLDTCLIGKATERMLGNGSTYTWGCFFYVNDDKIITFVKLIAPDMIGKIHELVHVA
jgi:hypothetical protein